MTIRKVGDGAEVFYVYSSSELYMRYPNTSSLISQVRQYSASSHEELNFIACNVDSLLL